MKSGNNCRKTGIPANNQEAPPHTVTRNLNFDNCYQTVLPSTLAGTYSLWKAIYGYQLQMPTFLHPTVQLLLGTRFNGTPPPRTRTHANTSTVTGTKERRRSPGCTRLSGQRCNGPQAQTSGWTAAPARRTGPQPFQKQLEPRPCPAGRPAASSGPPQDPSATLLQHASTGRLRTVPSGGTGKRRHHARRPPRLPARSWSPCYRRPGVTSSTPVRQVRALGLSWGPTAASAAQLGAGSGHLLTAAD